MRMISCILITHNMLIAGHDINERAIWSAATLVELDEAYTRKSMGCKDLDEFYRKSSCVHVLDKIKIPMVFVNSTGRNF